MLLICEAADSLVPSARHDTLLSAYSMLSNILMVALCEQARLCQWSAGRRHKPQHSRNAVCEDPPANRGSNRTPAQAARLRRPTWSEDMKVPCACIISATRGRGLSRRPALAHGLRLHQLQLVKRTDEQSCTSTAYPLHQLAQCTRH